MFSSDESANVAYKDFIIQVINYNIKESSPSIKEAIDKMTVSDDSNKEAVIQQKPVVELLDHLVSWFPKEVSKNWTKFGAFLEVNYLFISSVV